MNKLIEVYWDDLSERVQNELIESGYDNDNVIDGVFPIFVYEVHND